MSLQSMTGFARETGTHEVWRWAWEIRSVNGRGLEVKFKLPPGFDGLAEPLRRLAAGKLQRGSVFAALTAQRHAEANQPAIDEALLDALVDAAKRAASRHGLEAPRIEPLLAIRGVVETAEADDTEAEREATYLAVTEGFKRALEAVARARIEEGSRLDAVLAGQIASIEQLTESADACPARQPEAVRERLAKQLRELLDMSSNFDAERLHQEAVLIASRADVREEIDRLRAHVAAARELLAKGGAVGRRLDFLAQEFGREANTLTAKANDPALSRIGLELKSVVEQWREQVQNVE
ncbi:TIGR00255 family protein [Rhizobiales bacterium GAS113]|nr:TIGR00255 family protein [Rhizobiales bacterium GAS113]